MSDRNGSKAKRSTRPKRQWADGNGEPETFAADRFDGAVNGLLLGDPSAARRSPPDSASPGLSSGE